VTDIVVLIRTVGAARGVRYPYGYRSRGTLQCAMVPLCASKALRKEGISVECGRMSTGLAACNSCGVADPFCGCSEERKVTFYLVSATPTLVY
jgi:hypothetical protein